MPREDKPKKDVITAHYKFVDRTKMSAARISTARRVLAKAGIVVLWPTSSGWVVRATCQQIEAFMGRKVKQTPVTRRVHQFKRTVIRRSFEGLPSDAPSSSDPGNMGKFIFPVPAHHWVPSAYPPRPSYYHVHPCRDLPCLFGVEGLHAHGVTGAGIRIAMIDTGFYPHPYYQDIGIHRGMLPNITAHAVISNPNVDAVGHGTAIAANVPALAPQSDFHIIKHDDDTYAGLTLARTLNPQIITCSWGWPEKEVHDVFTKTPLSGEAEAYRDIEAGVQAAIAAGITVLFSSGNGNTPAGGPGNWPSSVPGVISVGGAFVNQALSLSASNIATSFRSIIYPNRKCPDVCGLVGPAPSALLFPLPTQPGSFFDTQLAPIDTTAPDDGWCITSGTSSAAPQLAAMAALLLQMYGPQTPQQILDRFKEMAVAVLKGKSATGDKAKGHPNLATGFGWVTYRRPHSKHDYAFF